MEQGAFDQAIGWFQRAKRALRYEPRHFPYLNLGRLHASRGEIAEAVIEFEGALEHNPNDQVALRFLDALKLQIN
jgi:Tfp pilus assembly protein PilF